MRRSQRIDRPSVIFVVSNQCPDADDRVIDVLGEFVAGTGKELRAVTSVAARPGAETLRVHERARGTHEPSRLPPHAGKAR
jgi:hypothetical protein